MLPFSQKYIRDGEPLDNTLVLEEKFAIAGHGIFKRNKEKSEVNSTSLLLFQFGCFKQGSIS